MARSTVLAATVLAVLVCGAAAQCSQYTDCQSCTDIGGCGWCSSNGGSCMEGTPSSSNDGTCSGASWSWDSCSAAAVCASQTDCASCTKYSSLQCGWCLTTNTCYDGTPSGNEAGTCNTPAWAWTDSQCTTSNNICGEYTDCSGCAAIHGCGWCSDTNTCMAGSITGSNDGSCVSNDWDWAVDTCGNTCNEQTTCSSCISQGNCGWCSSTSTCMIGSLTGSNDGTCTTVSISDDDSSDWFFERCPCSEHDDCTDCVGDANCGWCSSSSSCMAGGANSPNGANFCSDWDWATCDSGYIENGGLAWTLGAFFGFIVLLALVRAVYWRRRRRYVYRPVGTTVVNNTTVVPAQPPGGYYQGPPQQGYYNGQQAVPPQQYPVSYQAAPPAYGAAPGYAPPAQQYAPPPQQYAGEFPPASATGNKV